MVGITTPTVLPVPGGAQQSVERVSFNNMKAAVLAAYAGGKKENILRFYKGYLYNY